MSVGQVALLVLAAVLVGAGRLFERARVVFFGVWLIFGGIIAAVTALRP